VRLDCFVLLLSRLESCVYSGESIIPTVIGLSLFIESSSGLHFHMANATAKLVLIQPEVHTEPRQVQ